MKLGTYTFDRPALYLAPMDDVTDAPFRDICHRMGADVTVSEFIASDALIREIEVIRRKLISGPESIPSAYRFSETTPKASAPPPVLPKSASRTS